MDIRFISTLTADDEDSFAPALLQAIGSLLDKLPIAYTVRIETTGARVFQHTHPAVERSYPTRDDLPFDGALSPERLPSS
jgi:hypothetical protein